MRPDSVVTLAAFARGEQVMAVCNACRYCEQYCPVFPAMEERVAFGKRDLTYLANLCHNCGECLYACQFAPPHEFGINVPQTLARIRLRSYEEYCWPPVLGVAFRRNGVATALGLVAALTTLMFASTWAMNPSGLQQTGGDFYAVVPHGVMVSLFGGVGVFVLVALGLGLRGLWRDVQAGSVRPAVATVLPDGRVGGAGPSLADAWRALRDAFTLRHLHTTGVDCTSAEDTRGPWRRWFHHCTLYGFMLCFASTSVAAVYHVVFGWLAPYDRASLPVLLGTVGGLGLLVGPAGLLGLRRQRDPDLGDADQKGMDEAFIVLLWLTSLTGLVLLVLRNQSAMGALLMVHLGAVLALLLTLPYGKFVHGIYRTAALVKYATESRR